MMVCMCLCIIWFGLRCGCEGLVVVDVMVYVVVMLCVIFN